MFNYLFQELNTQHKRPSKSLLNGFSLLLAIFAFGTLLSTKVNATANNEMTIPGHSSASNYQIKSATIQLNQLVINALTSHYTGFTGITGKTRRIISRSIPLPRLKSREKLVSLTTITHTHVGKQTQKRSRSQLLNPNILGSVAINIGRNKYTRRWARINLASQTIKAKHISSLTPKKTSHGLGRLIQINQHVNKLITYKSDSKAYGAKDHWASFKETTTRRTGDCEDYVIVKYTLLRHLGVKAGAMQMVIVKDIKTNSYHAILAVHQGKKIYYLDNRSPRLLQAADISHYMPMMSFSGSKSWIHGFRPSHKMATRRKSIKGSITPG